MLHHFLSNFSISGILCQNGNIAMHVVVDLDTFGQRLVICLQTTVEIMYFNPRYSPGSGIEQFRRQVFCQLVVVPLLLPSGDQIETILFYHTVEFGYFIGTVLQVSIHGDDYITLCFLKSTMQCRRLTVVTAKFNCFYVLRFFTKLFDDLPRTVGASVIHENDLI